MNTDFNILNNQGFIPGLKETKEEFYQRVNFCQDILSKLVQETGHALPFDVKDLGSSKYYTDVFELTELLYGIKPEWVPLFFSNYQLSFWHGGCAWIFQLNASAPLSAFLQLRTNFRFSSTYLKVYHRKELIAHELSHVGRLMLEEPKFEEIFAYQTSPYLFRRLAGPLVQSSTESLIFILVLGLIILTDLALIASGYPIFAAFNNGLKFIPIFFILYAALRLTYRKFVLSRCLKNLTPLTTNLTQARHLMYRLGDKEINQFSKWPTEKIKNFIENHALYSFYWNFLNKLYININ